MDAEAMILILDYKEVDGEEKPILMAFKHGISEEKYWSFHVSDLKNVNQWWYCIRPDFMMDLKLFQDGSDFNLYIDYYLININYLILFQVSFLPSDDSNVYNGRAWPEPHLLILLTYTWINMKTVIQIVLFDCLILWF